MRFPPDSEPHALRTQRLPQIVPASRRHDSQLRGASGRIASCCRPWKRAATGAPHFRPRRSSSRQPHAIPCIRCSPARLPGGGRLVDVMSYCFRHEPSDDAGRMQMFRMHEHVRAAGRRDRDGMARDVARARRVVPRRRSASRRARTWPPIRSSAAAARCSPRTSADQQLKLEIVAPIASDERPTAIISLNYHQDHFGELFGIKTADGVSAHTACVGFGLERITLALYRRHGLRPRAVGVTGARGALELVKQVWLLDPATYTRHPLHASDRVWPESNCYVDLWFELLHTRRSRAAGRAAVHVCCGHRGRPVDVLQVSSGGPLTRSTASRSSS